MDSLTQITLGAAVGEVVLGKKVGNKAMFWGAVAGTIPDLDILANLATDDMGALAFHRGITHSIPFAIIAPFALGWLVHRLYQASSSSWTELLKRWTIVGTAFFLIISFGAMVQPIPFWDAWKIGINVSIGIMSVPLLILLWRKLKTRDTSDISIVSWTSWAWLFFWAIFTHPLLDSCTAFGTQLFQPFWDYRVAFNNISVADPIYTLPFLICVIIASCFNRNHPKRQFFNYLGIGLSSAYMLFTVYNKIKVDNIFEASLQKQGIEYSRFTVSPTIFNNILWQGVAETDSFYYHGMYSLLDTKDEISIFVPVAKNHDWLKDKESERAIQILKWFSNDYYTIIQRQDGHYQFNDLRYGSINGQSFDQESDYVFSFVLKKEGGGWKAYEKREVPEDASEIVDKLWERIKGE